MVRTVFIDTDVITNQLDALPKNRFAFGFLCGQTTRGERDFIHFIVDAVSNEPKDLESFFEASSTNKELCAKIIEITSSLCAGVSIVGFYCRAKSETLKSTNFTLKIRRLFEILQKALQTYSPWSVQQSDHRILLQAEMTGGANKWLVKTMDLSATNVAFRPVEMKPFDSRTQTNWCFTTTIPVQFPLFFTDVGDLKLLEKQFEDQLRNYVEQLKESLLLMDERLLPEGKLNLAERNSFDIQWLAPIDGPVLNAFSEENRRCYQIDGSVSLRLFTTFNETSGSDLREYFLEDLFRSMLIRMNLALVNSETSTNSDEFFSQFVLPRRVFPTRPLFISAYQLPTESLPMVIESLQENFKINSILEDDLEVAEQFPPTKNDENDEIPPTKIVAPTNFLQENKVLLLALSAIFVLLIAVLLKLFS